MIGFAEYMEIDPQYLRLHYASLSDETLLATDRGELVDVAQKVLDEEFARRKLRRSAEQAVGYEPALGERPAWFEDAAEVFSRDSLPGQLPAAEVEEARVVLEAAGIPAYIDVQKIQDEESSGPVLTHYIRVVVPGGLNLQAASVLDRDIFNAEFEGVWRTHLEALSDDDVRAMNPRAVFCGLYDRIERVARAYEEEMTRRGLA
jgi:hypothetical protein